MKLINPSAAAGSGLQVAGPLLSPDEVSRLYDRKPSTRVVLDMIHAGELKARRVRRRYYLKYENVVAVLGEP